MTKINENRFARFFVVVFLLSCLIVPAVFSGVNHLRNKDDAVPSAQLMNPIMKKDFPMPARPFKPLKLSCTVPYKTPASPFLPDGSGGKGKNQRAEAPELVKAPEGYFKDALFIGDSRTVGIWEYGDFTASDFFCSTGMTSIDVFKDEVDVRGIGNTGLKDLLNEKQYGKIYVMLGINELGYPKDSIIAAYKKLIGYIRNAQPDAVLYIQGNLHITKERSDSDEYFNNKRIDSINRRIEKFADNRHIFYIEANERFDDKNGALDPKYSSDSAHLLAKYYRDWCEWIRNHTVPDDAVAD